MFALSFFSISNKLSLYFFSEHAVFYFDFILFLLHLFKISVKESYFDKILVIQERQHQRFVIMVKTTQDHEVNDLI